MFIMSHGSMIGSIMSVYLISTMFCLALTKAMLKIPFCSSESPSCQIILPHGTPTVTAHLMSSSLMHSRKFISKQELYASRRTNRARPRVIGKTSSNSNDLIMSTKMSEVMLPFLLDRHKHVIILLRKEQVGSCRKAFAFTTNIFEKKFVTSITHRISL